MHIQKRKEILCAKQFQLYTWYIKGLVNREQYLMLLKPLDAEIDALEMKIYVRYLRKHMSK